MNPYAGLLRMFKRLFTHEEFSEGGTLASNFLSQLPGASILMSPVMTAAATPYLKTAEQESNKNLRMELYPDAFLNTLYLRGEITPSVFDEELARRGYSEEKIAQIKKALFLIPPVPDLIRMMVKEVFNPVARQKYALDEDYDIIQKDYEKWTSAQGLLSNWAKNYWAAHWVLPGVDQVFDMFHRQATWPNKPPWNAKVFNEEDMRDFLKVADYSPAFRDLLIQIAYTPLTRVDIRRMEDLGVLDDEEVLKAYRDIGYSPTNAKYMLAFTKAYNRAVELRTRYSKGYVNAETVKAEFKAIFLAADFTEEKATAKAQTWFEKVVKTEGPDRVAAEKNLTKAEIVKGVKKFVDASNSVSYWQDQLDKLRQGIPIAYEKSFAEEQLQVAQKTYNAAPIDVEGGVQLLMGLGYDEAEANYILYINIESLSGSPDTKAEFTKLVELHKLALGQSGKPVPDKLIEAERAYKSGQADIELARSKGATTKTLDKLTLLAEQAKAVYFKLLQEYKKS